MDSSDSDSGPITKTKKRARDERKAEGSVVSVDKKNWKEAKRLKKQRAEENTIKKFEKNNRKKEEKRLSVSEGDALSSGRLESLEQGQSATTIGQGRPYTVSIAVPGSIIDNAQSPALKAYLAGQVARAAAIYRVDEVIVYDDTGGHASPGCELMARVLQFLECPQYLRKDLFPIHPDLQYAGLIAPLDAPHHLRKNETLPYREGVVSKKPMKDGKDYALVNVGLDRDCRVAKKLPPGVRVTIKFENSSPDYILKAKGKLKGTVVSPHAPRREAGLYWGYSVRLASSLGAVFSEGSFKEGYDLKLGTSDKGTDCRLLKKSASAGFQHLLIVFGGVEGLEYALENDEGLAEDDASALFHHYVNTCPSQGSRTIRTEEAILISMQALASFIHAGNNDRVN